MSYGHDPVFADVDDMLAREQAAEARDAHVESCVEDAVHDLMSGRDDSELLYVIANAGDHTKRRPVSAIFDRVTGECTAQTNDEWQRVLYVAPLDHAQSLVIRWREWALQQAVNLPEVLQRARVIADEQEALWAEDAALARAGL